MNSSIGSYKLSNGVDIPAIGFGTWQAPDGEVAVASVLSAIEAGYRHIDTAQVYDNEESVGTAVKKSGIAREKLFITSKIANKNRGYEETFTAFDTTMKKLDMDYLDLYLIHWPNPAKYCERWQETNAATWKAMEELYRSGRIRAIGISNFRPHHIEELLKTAAITPMVNQIRLCPGDTQDEVVDCSRAQGMIVEAYSPLGVGKIFEIPEMITLSQKYGKSIAQICIRWSLQQGYLPLPKSVTASRIRENLKVFDFELDPADVKLIADLKGCVGYSNNPDTTVF